MKVIFLDIDGVLNSSAFIDDRDAAQAPRELYTASSIDPAAVMRLNAIIMATGAKVVISSSWRGQREQAEIQAILNHCGFDGEIIDVTPQHCNVPDYVTLRQRGDEIAYWLAQHPEVTGFVILDDGADMGNLFRRLVRTDFQLGLTDDDVARAIRVIDIPMGGL